MATWFRNVMAVVVALGAGCGNGPGGASSIGATHQALTGDQCAYFAHAGTDSVCHATHSSKNPYVLLPVEVASCDEHAANHPNDFIDTANPPSCASAGCLPEGAPSDPKNALQPCCGNLSGASGTCQCATGLTFCLDEASCVNEQTDVANCGGCGVVCATSVANATATCSSGSCGFACDDGYTLCNCACVATSSFSTDVNNCGGCGVVCPSVANATSTCTAGVCGFSCDAGFTNCGGACVDSEGDASNCGGCGVACPDGQGCIHGACDGAPLGVLTLGETTIHGTTDVPITISASDGDYANGDIVAFTVFLDLAGSGVAAGQPVLASGHLTSSAPRSFDVSHPVFVHAGTYSIGLEVVDLAGRAATTVTALTVTTPASWVELVAATPDVNPGNVVQFIATAHWSDPNATLSYSFDFGDGDSCAGCGNVAQHAYSGDNVVSSGIVPYNVTVTVTDGTGATASATAPVLVEPPDHAPCAALAAASTTVGNPVTLDATASFDIDANDSMLPNTIVEYRWTIDGVPVAATASPTVSIPWSMLSPFVGDLRTDPNLRSPVFAIDVVAVDNYGTVFPGGLSKTGSASALLSVF